jgi:hypothetical protein
MVVVEEAQAVGALLAQEPLVVMAELALYSVLLILS